MSEISMVSFLDRKFKMKSNTTTILSDSDLFRYIYGHRPIILTQSIINLDKD